VFLPAPIALLTAVFERKRNDLSNVRLKCSNKDEEWLLTNRSCHREQSREAWFGTRVPGNYTAHGRVTTQNDRNKLPRTPHILGQSPFKTGSVSRNIWLTIIVFWWPSPWPAAVLRVLLRRGILLCMQMFWGSIFKTDTSSFKSVI